jgi:hypothetical protein
MSSTLVRKVSVCALPLPFTSISTARNGASSTATSIFSAGVTR